MDPGKYVFIEDKRNQYISYKHSWTVDFFLKDSIDSMKDSIQSKGCDFIHIYLHSANRDPK